MLNQRSKSLIRALIYPIQFDPDPIDGVDRVLTLVVKARALGATPAEYLTSTSAALKSPEKLSGLIPQDHSEKVIRAYLAEVQKRLGSMRMPAAGKRSARSASRVPEVARNS